MPTPLSSPWRFALAIVLAALVSHSRVSGATPARPNLVLIFADDLGWKDVGYQGSEFCQTPHIDQLAKDGMVFTNGYAAAGNCAPSRACLLSGNYTPRHHVYAVGSTNRGPQSLMRLVPISNKGGLAPENVTIADALKANGYATGCFGKWHLAGKDGALPTEQGFDVAFDSFGEGKLEEGSEGNKAGPRSDPKGVYTLSNKALDFIKEHRSEPFFCYLSHHAIHTPLQGRDETRQKFAEELADNQPNKMLYASCTYDLDDSIGRFLNGLDQLGLSEKTVVVFTSDNGATNASPQEPLRGNKGCYYEGGIREPFIVRWPGVVEAGSRCEVPVINLDLFPTFLELAGGKLPGEKQLDGESLLPLLTQSGSLERTAIFWHFPGYLDRPVIRGRDPVFRTRPVSVIRKGDWKLHLYHEEWALDGGAGQLDRNNAVELYNLKDDMGERENLSQMSPEKRDELLGDLLSWFESTNAKLPIEPNPAYDPDGTPKTGGRTRKRGNGR
ncbi:MAG: sulfatase [Planctomycetaceae bacterium]|nr:sulfatase [Planctomycetaceae bacterium]